MRNFVPAVRALTAAGAAVALTAGLTQAWPTSALQDRLYAKPLRYAAGAHPVSELAAGDLNGDGAADIVTTHDNAAPVSVLLSDGRGRHGPPRNLQGDNLVGQPVLADVDRDGDLDVVLPDRPGPMLNVLVNDGRGRLRARTHHVAHRPDRHAFGARYASASVVDVDGDRRADLVGVSHALGVVRPTAGGWRPVRMTPLPAAFREHPMIAGDVDADSDTDVVIGPSRDGRVLVLSNDGSGVFGGGRTYAAGTVVRPPPKPECRGEVCGLALNPDAAAWTDLAAADLDVDGDLDLAVAHSRTPGLSVLPGDGRGGFGSPVRVASGLRGAAEVVVADVDGDPVPDLVALARDDGVAVLSARPGGGYRPAAVSAVPVEGARNLTAADLDGDGDVDLAVSEVEGNDVIVLPNRTRRAR